MKYILEIEINDIGVDEEYFSFDYIVKKDGKKWKHGSYESDYQNGNTPKQQRKELEEKCYALELVLGNLV